MSGWGQQAGQIRPGEQAATIRDWEEARNFSTATSLLYRAPDWGHGLRLPGFTEVTGVTHVIAGVRDNPLYGYEVFIGVQRAGQAEVENLQQTPVSSV